MHARSVYFIYKVIYEGGYARTINKNIYYLESHVVPCDSSGLATYGRNDGLRCTLQFIALQANHQINMHTAKYGLWTEW